MSLMHVVINEGEYYLFIYKYLYENIAYVGGVLLPGKKNNVNIYRFSIFHYILL